MHLCGNSLDIVLQEVSLIPERLNFVQGVLIKKSAPQKQLFESITVWLSRSHCQHFGLVPNTILYANKNNAALLITTPYLAYIEKSEGGQKPKREHWGQNNWTFASTFNGASKGTVS